MPSFPSIVSLGLLAAFSTGCATLSETNQQLLTVHVISANREIAGVGCVLSNDAGRWFTTAPGRVLVTTSKSPLSVHCSKPGEGAVREQFASRYGALDMVGNVVATAGLGYLVDRHSGAGFAYPDTVTMLIYKPAAVAAVTGNGQGVADNVVW